MTTNWRDFGIGMASGVAFCFALYFGWGLISPQRPETVNSVTATVNAPVGMDENALIAANAERPLNSSMTPPPQLGPAPRNEAEPRVLLEPEPGPEPRVVRPRPEPVDEPPPEDLGPGDEDDGSSPIIEASLPRH